VLLALIEQLHIPVRAVLDTLRRIIFVSHVLLDVVLALDRLITVVRVVMLLLDLQTQLVHVRTHIMKQLLMLLNVCHVPILV
jgi:hypothetical protein